MDRQLILKYKIKCRNQDIPGVTFDQRNIAKTPDFCFYSLFIHFIKTLFYHKILFHKCSGECILAFGKTIQYSEHQNIIGPTISKIKMLFNFNFKVNFKKAKNLLNIPVRESRRLLHLYDLNCTIHLCQYDQRHHMALGKKQNPHFCILIWFIPKKNPTFYHYE